jgi:hypothetical protein
MEPTWPGHCTWEETSQNIALVTILPRTQYMRPNYPDTVHSISLPRTQHMRPTCPGHSTQDQLSEHIIEDQPAQDPAHIIKPRTQHMELTCPGHWTWEQQPAQDTAHKIKPRTQHMRLTLPWTLKMGPARPEHSTWNQFAHDKAHGANLPRTPNTGPAAQSTEHRTNLPRTQPIGPSCPEHSRWEQLTQDITHGINLDNRPDNRVFYTSKRFCAVYTLDAARLLEMLSCFSSLLSRSKTKQGCSNNRDFTVLFMNYRN